jgi:hypothetical protein
MPQETRSDLARARDIWLASDEGGRCCEGTVDGIYLRNRIECAFLAGARIAEDRINEKLVAMKKQMLELINSISD